MDTDYNLWRDLLDNYQSLSQTLQILWLIVPPTFVLALITAPGWTLQRRRRGSERRGWRVWQQGWQRELHESQTTLESTMGCNRTGVTVRCPKQAPKRSRLQYDQHNRKTCCAESGLKKRAQAKSTSRDNACGCFNELRRNPRCDYCGTEVIRPCTLLDHSQPVSLSELFMALRIAGA